MSIRSVRWMGRSWSARLAGRRERSKAMGFLCTNVLKRANEGAKLVAAVELVEERAEAGEAGREQDHIARRGGCARILNRRRKVVIRPADEGLRVGAALLHRRCAQQRGEPLGRIA